MNNISEKYQRILELDRVLEELSTYACCEYARDSILKIKPSTDLDFVIGENQKTNDAFFLSSHYGTPQFIKMADPTEHLKLAQVGGILTPRAILNIASILRQVRLLKEWFSQCENRQNSLKTIFENLIVNKQLENEINKVFLSEDEIDDFASEELYDIRRKIKQIGVKIKENLDKMVRSSTYQKVLQENIITMRDGRYVVPVKAEYKGQVSGLVHDTSSSGATLFVEPMAIVEANNDIRVLKAKEKAEIERIMAELSAKCGESSESVIFDFDLAIRLNIYFSKANFAAKMNAVMPKITSSGRVRLNKARHPLISKDKVVPISLELGVDYTSIVITGPNTGGKTVTLKTIGLLTLMTMCGMLIPVSDDSEISIFSRVLVDIGDEQSIEQNLSTFSAHMTNIVSILSKADEKSLILLDELGSGTDPVEGAAIATAVLEELRRRKSIVAATTHYAELKVYALQTDGVQNACCEFDVKTLKPTYRLLTGTPGRSNAFAISRKLGLPENVLSEASELIANDKKNFEDVIDSLEAKRQEYEEKSAELQKVKREADLLKEQLEHSNANALSERDKIIEKAREDARRIVEHVKLDSQLIIDELEKIKKEKDKENFSQMASAAKSQIRGRIDKLHDAANPVEARSNEGYVLPRKLKVGDSVLIFDIDKNATVLELPDKKGNVLLQAGIMKTRVPISNLRLIDKPKTQFKGSTQKTVTSSKNASATTELDLRGTTVEEALLELDMFINHALLTKINIFTIIHGKGTGALRSAVHGYLKKCKYVKSFRLGVYGEGEAGVTIAELK